MSEENKQRMSVTENGEFVKANDFEQIWVAKNVNDQYAAPKVLNDDDYIEYQLWVDMNYKKLYKKYLPRTLIFKGENPNIIFHGGCLGCLSQRLHGFERCKGCLYFRFNCSLPDLKIKGEETAKMSAEEFKRILGGE